MTAPFLLPSLAGSAPSRTPTALVPRANEERAQVGRETAAHFESLVITGKIRDDRLTALQEYGVLPSDDISVAKSDGREIPLTLKIPGVGGVELAQRKTEIAKELAQILDVARQAAKELDPDSPSGQKTLREIGAAAANDIAQLLTKFDAQTGGNAVDLFRGALEGDLANFPQAIQQKLANDPVGALFQITSASLGVALPVGRTLAMDAGTWEKGAAGRFRSAEATLHDLAKGSGASGAGDPAQNRSGAIDIRRPDMDTHFLAQRKTKIAKELTQTLDVARQAAKELDPDSPSGQKTLREIGAVAANDIAQLLTKFDAQTGGNAVDVFRGALEGDLANFPQSIQQKLANDPVGALFQITSASLGVALPVGRTLAMDAGPWEKGAAARFRSAEATLHELAKASGASGAGYFVHNRSGAIDIRRLGMDTRFATASIPSARVSGVTGRAMSFGDAMRAESAGDPAAMALKAMPMAAAQDNHRVGEALRVTPSVPLPQNSQSRLISSLANQIRDARLTAGADGGRTRIELSPRGLGDLEIDLNTGPSGRVHIVIRAENPLVLDAMRADRDMLGDMLSEGRDSGTMDLDFASFEDDRDHQEDADDPSDDTDTGASEGQTDTGQTAGAITSGLIDIFT